MRTNERPILFNADMVLALLAGRKLQTRRALSASNLRDINIGSQLGECHPLSQLNEADMAYLISFCPFGRVGDLLYVRETFAMVGDPGIIPCPRKYLVYRADYPNCVDKSFDSDSIPEIKDVRFTPSIHMPKWASRIQLEITAIRIERITDISVKDAISEGIEPQGNATYRDYESNGEIRRNNPVDSFKTLWRSTGGQWNDTVYVWVIDFRLLSRSVGP